MEDKVLETVVNGLEYTPLQDILVKPLAPIMLKKEVTEAVEVPAMNQKTEEEISFFSPSLLSDGLRQ